MSKASYVDVERVYFKDNKPFRTIHAVKGDYVLTPVANAFNDSISYWISKKGYTAALYCFSATDEDEVARQKENMDSYIRMFEDRIERR